MYPLSPIDKALNLMSFILYSGEDKIGYKCVYPPELGGGTMTGFRISPDVVEVSLDCESIQSSYIDQPTKPFSVQKPYLYSGGSKKAPDPKPNRPGLYVVKPDKEE